MSLPVPSELSSLSFLPLLEKNQGGLFVLHGHKEAGPLAQKLLAFPLSRNEPVMVLDAGNLFDPYLITRMAQALGRDPRELLSKILISRSFTCHQTHSLAEKVAMFKGNARHFILILGLLATFYDEEIALGERRALLQKTLTLLKGISRTGRKVLVTSTDPPFNMPGGLDCLLVKTADKAARVGQNPDGSLNVNSVKQSNASVLLRK